MPHTTTKVQRTKRVDTRPNEKERKKVNLKNFKSETVQDLKITSKGSKTGAGVDGGDGAREARREREVQATPMANLSQQEKLLRALRKKLNAINELVQREEGGEMLDSQQMKKVDSLGSVVAAMQEIVEESEKQNGRADRSDGGKKRKAEEVGEEEEEEEEGEEEKESDSESDGEVKKVVKKKKIQMWGKGMDKAMRKKIKKGGKMPKFVGKGGERQEKKKVTK